MPTAPGTMGPSKTTPPPQGRINGRGAVNGSSRGNINGTNRGAVNGTGMINGRGAVNGTGLVNGMGLTNGTSMASRSSGQSSRRTRTLHWKLLALLVALVIVVPSVIFIVYSDKKAIAIDGNFDDWNSVPKFGMRTVAPLSEIAVYEWAVNPDGNTLSVFLRVQGAVMGSAQVDSFYLFVDNDNTDATGYYVSGIGADYLLAFDGWDGIVQSALLMEFPVDGDSHNWSSWMRAGTVTSATKSGMLEAAATLGEAVDPEARFLLLAQNNVQNSVYSLSYPVPSSGGVLIIRQEPGSSVSAAGTIPKGPSEVLASLTVKCQGRGGVVASIAPVVSGASLKSPIRDITLIPDQQQTFDLLVDTSLVPETYTASLLLREFDVTSNFDQIVIEGDVVSAYVSSPPPTIKIDGAFGDWIGKTSIDNDTNPVPNPNVDLASVGAANSTTSAYFYVAVKGELYEGAYAPSLKTKPTTMGGGGGSVMEKRQSGEDLLRIYIDADSSNDTGYVVSHPGKTVGAEYLIEIAGVDGLITSQGLSRYSSGDWIPDSASISIEKDMQRIELSVFSSSIGGTTFSCIVETTDWRSRGDWAGTGTAPDPWVVDAAGNAYQTTDGVTWSYVGRPALVSGDRIVDISLSTNGATVFMVTNTGRTYYWDLATGTNWTAGQTRPIDTATYGEAIAMTFYSRTAAWLFTQTGAYFWLMDVTASKRDWTFQDYAAGGYTDFSDLYYNSGTMYALRYTPNAPLLYSLNGNSFTSVTAATGSTSPQIEFTYIAGGAGALDDRIFVLCENGNIRYSFNGGSSWSALGNLPVPTGGNTSKYSGLGIDSTGYMWVVTDSGYCYRSTDTTTYNSFSYAGRAPISGIVAVVPLPIIPEFQGLLVPLIAVIATVLFIRRRPRAPEAREAAD